MERVEIVSQGVKYFLSDCRHKLIQNKRTHKEIKKNPIRNRENPCKKTRTNERTAIQIGKTGKTLTPNRIFIVFHTSVTSHEIISISRELAPLKKRFFGGEGAR